jgi:hypothetical protein
VSAPSYNFVTITIQCPINEKLLITRGIAANAVSFYLGTLWHFYVTKNLHLQRRHVAGPDIEFKGDRFRSRRMWLTQGLSVRIPRKDLSNSKEYASNKPHSLPSEDDLQRSAGSPRFGPLIVHVPLAAKK